MPKESIAEYQRIEADLRKRIVSGQWAVGAMLPSRRDLARQYRVSPATMERAITPLIADGTLRSDDRRGTFVNRPKGDVSSARDRMPEIGAPADTEALPDRLARSMTIGVIGRIRLDPDGYTDQNSGWVRTIVQSMERAFSRDGDATVFFNRHPDDSGSLIPLDAAIAAAVAERVDALAVVTLDHVPSEVDEALSVLGASHLPVVCVLAGELTRPIPHVFYDNTAAGYQAAHHLLLRGYERISVIAPFSASWVNERIEGIRTALLHAGLGQDALDILTDSPPWSYQEDPADIAERRVRAALAQGWKPADALVGISDGVAEGVIRTLAETGRELGVDYAMVGFDDNPTARTMRLTSMRPPVEAMGEEAARLLLMGLHGEPISTQVRLRAHLIPRKSTSRAAASRGSTAPVA